MIELVLSGIQGYLLGSVIFGIIVTRLLGKSGDIRKEGSGNVGATNVLRTQGKLQAELVLAGDLLKGVLAAWIGMRLGGIPGGAIAGICAMLGHCFPVFFGFKGGKMVATAAGILIILVPQSMLVLVPMFVLTVAVSKMVSLGSIVAALSLIVTLFVLSSPTPVSAFGIVAAVMIIGKHHENIRRILSGTESRMSK